MERRLYIAEKPSQARALVKALGGARLVKNDPSRFAGYYEAKSFYVIWAKGHLYQLSEPADHDPRWGKWDLDSLPIIIEKHFWLVRGQPGDLSTEEIQEQLNLLQTLLDKVTAVIVATDPDPQGTLIGQNIVTKSGWSGPTYRLLSQSLQEKDLYRAAMNVTPLSEHQGEYQAAYARTVGDQLIGFNFSRLFTLLARNAGYQFMAIAGRVKSPALGIIVHHTQAFRNHKGTEYHTCTANFDSLSSTSATIEAKLEIPSNLLSDGKHCTERNTLEAYANTIKAGDIGKVANFSSKSHPTSAPEPFSQNTLGQHMAETCNWAPSKTIAISQKLYEKKLTTYPRVESHHYESEASEDCSIVLENLKLLKPDLAPVLNAINLDWRPPAFNTKAVVAHAAIAATSKQLTGSTCMDEDETALYIAVAKRMLVQFMPPRTISTSHLSIHCKGLVFKAEAKHLSEKGWEALEDRKHEDSKLPTLTQNQDLRVRDIELHTRHTKAPSRLTKASFLAALEDCTPYLSKAIAARIGRGQLGTGATQPYYLDELIRLKHAKVVNNKYIESTPLGEQLHDLLPSYIARCDLTSVWELHFRNITAGRGSASAFLSEARAVTAKTISDLKKNSRFKISPMLQKCPKCQQALQRKKYKDSQDHYWKCYACNHFAPDYLALPMRPLKGDGALCKKCGQPLTTKLRSRKPGDTNRTERRYLSCPKKCTQGIKPKSHTPKYGTTK